jgi:hypothetical protein
MYPVFSGSEMGSTGLNALRGTTSDAGSNPATSTTRKDVMRNKKHIPSVLCLFAMVLFLAVGTYQVYQIFNRPAPIQDVAPKTRDIYDTETLKGFIQANNDKVFTSEVISRKYNIPPVLILSVMQAESRFDPWSISSEKAKGLMQINLEVWRDALKKEGIITNDSEVYDPVKNIEAGCFILRAYLNETKDFERAMNKYLGVYYKPYIDKIGSNAGNIWMLTISKSLNATYRIKK